MVDHKRYTLATDHWRVLLRPANSVATQIERKHQWAAAAVLPQKGRTRLYANKSI